MLKWGQPANSKKFHVFHDSRSLCMKWLYGGADQVVTKEEIDRLTVNGPTPRDCAECVKRLIKQMGR